MRLAAALALLLAADVAMAATIHVPGDQPTIQAGIDAAALGDTVLVACGTYYEFDLVLASDVHLLGEIDDPACVTVDANGSGRSFSATDIGGSTIRGVEFIRGRAPSPGYAATIVRSAISFEHCGLSQVQAPTAYGYANCLVTESDAAFTDCDFLDNDGRAVTVTGSTASFHGCEFRGGSVRGWEGTAGALVDDGSTAHFEDCMFSLNSLTGGWGSYGYAAALAMQGSSTTVTGSGCLFEDNDGNRGSAGAVYASGGTLTLDDCTFTSNVGWLGADAVWTKGGASTTLTRCRFNENDGSLLLGVAGGSLLVLESSTVRNHWYSESVAVAAYRGTAQLSQCTLTRGRSLIEAHYSPATVTVDRSILAYAYYGDAVSVIGSATVALSCTDVFGNGEDWVGPIADQAGINGNFSADPLFCDLDAGDLTLRSDSPCLPGNHPDGADCGLVGALGEGCGPISVEPETWAGIKARYRR